MSKVLVIGLDGATMDLIEPWSRQGKLPILASMMERGSYGRLQSVMPVLSSAAWSSFMTGMNPAKHSLYDFARREPGSYRLRVMRRDHNQADSLWKILSQYGYRVGVMNVPMTYPAEPVNGFLVSGLGTPDYQTFTYPPTLGKELLEHGYRINKRVAYHPGNEAAYLREVNELADRQLENALWLMQSREWDFFMIVFFDTDQLAHFFWRFMDPNHPAHESHMAAEYGNAILDFYQKMDRSIGKLNQAAGVDTTVFVLSDHGTGPAYRDVFLNEWLRQEGYLATVDEEPRLKGRHRLFARLGLTRNGVSSTLRSIGLGRVEGWIKTALGDRIELLPRTQRAEFPQAIDWTRTRAYSFGYQGQIYINLQGREPQGTVSPGAAYNQLCDEITQRLMALTDPQDGKLVVDQVFRREQIFSGPYIDFAPDLTLVMRGISYNTRQGYEFSAKAGKIFSDPVTFESGSHRPQGILFASGPPVRQGGLKEGAQLVDLAPTILALMGIPVPEGMDGRILEDWVNVAPITSNKLSPVNPVVNRPPEAEFTDAEEQEMLRRLKDLGYLE
jgi:predicted AlkP superfamily phosphohydrolase/phosphomutase